MKYKKLHKDAKVPFKGTLGSAGYDIFPLERVFLHPGQYTKVSIGLAFEIPFGMEGMIRGRSSFGEKGILVFPGTIDSDYRGEVSVQMWNLTGQLIALPVHKAIGQIVFSSIEEMGFTISNELSVTTRKGGFGSTDKELV